MFEAVMFETCMFETVMIETGMCETVRSNAFGSCQLRSCMLCLSIVHLSSLYSPFIYCICSNHAFAFVWCIYCPYWHSIVILTNLSARHFFPGRSHYWQTWLGAIVDERSSQCSKMGAMADKTIQSPEPMVDIIISSNIS